MGHARHLGIWQRIGVISFRLFGLLFLLFGELGDRFVGAARVDVGHHDIGSFVEEPTGDGLADTASGRAGDERSPAGEAVDPGQAFAFALAAKSTSEIFSAPS